MEIDIVILWLDSNDASWQRSFNQYAPPSNQIETDQSEERFRDWGCLRYWFRGIEQFAPWVRKVHLVTANQAPKWINKYSPKLHLVNHEDFIPKEYLPTFSCNPIENNLHRIEGLAEHFIYFNDDFFLTSKVTPERFFRKGLPTDMAVVNTIQSDGMMGHITLNDLDAINRHFSKRQVLRSSCRWFNLRYGMFGLRTLALLPWPRFSGFYDHHLPQGFCKSTFEEVWQAEPELLHETCTHRFRHMADVNQWLFRYWHLCKGQFAPLNVTKDAVMYKLDNHNFAQAVNTVRSQRKAIVVLNDSNELSDFENKKLQLQAAFETILPNKSIFEK